MTLSDKSGHTYPLIQYIQVRRPYSGRQQEVYLKLRKTPNPFQIAPEEGGWQSIETRSTIRESRGIRPAPKC